MLLATSPSSSSSSFAIAAAAAAGQIFLTSRSICLLWILLVSNVLRATSLDAPPVHIPGQGVLIGTYLKMFRTQNIKAYLGVQYAEAVRFAPPEVITTSFNRNGIWNATTYAPDCWQKPATHDKDTQFVQQLLRGDNNRRRDDIQRGLYDENCLYLNVFVPDGSPGRNKYSVMVWFHSGDFSHGTAKDIDPFQLVFKQKVILVTVQYRLSIFGFLSTGDAESPGNFGLMDQAAALFWIRKNINHFGGDENDITIMGHAAGAVSVGLHLVSGEWSRDAFTKAIMMSGNPLTEDAVRTPKDYEQALEIIAKDFGCLRKPSAMFVQCLRRVEASIIMQNIPDVEWGPVVDSRLNTTSLPFIEDYPLELFKKGYYQKVPILMGITDQEDVLALSNAAGATAVNDGMQAASMDNRDYGSFMSEIVIDDIKKSGQMEIECVNVDVILDALNYVYRNQNIINGESNDDDNDGATSLTAVSAGGGGGGMMKINEFINFYTDRTYIVPLYLLADVLSRDQNVYVYVFNTKPKTQFYNLADWIRVPKYFDQLFIWGIPYMNNLEMITEWNPSDKKIADIVMTLWANFAKSSNPTSSNVYLKWDTYNTRNRTLLVVDENFQAKILKNNHIINFWNTYYPRLLRFAVECCNYTNDATLIAPWPLSISNKLLNFNDENLFGSYSILHISINMILNSICYICFYGFQRIFI